MAAQVAGCLHLGAACRVAAGGNRGLALGGAAPLASLFPTALPCLGGWHRGRKLLQDPARLPGTLFHKPQSQ